MYLTEKQKLLWYIKIIKEDWLNAKNYNDKELKEFEKKNIVGLDPGKKFMAYMMDEDGKKLKYSASQRKIESMAKRNNRILLTEKKKNKVIEKETKLSEQNSKTIDYKKFKKLDIHIYLGIRK